MGKRGPAPGTGGRPKKAISEKILEGNPGKRPLKVLDLPVTSESKIPNPHEYLSEKQKNGRKLLANDIYKNTWQWLKNYNCEKLVTTELIERYSMSAARWIQCEQGTSEYGLIAKSPSNGAPIPSPFVAMSNDYMKQANHIWSLIYQIVRENCTIEIKGQNPNDDVMERLLTTRRES